MNHLIKLNNENFNDTLDATASILLSKEDFVLIPTETVYGLACLWNNNEAKQLIYKAKSRPENKPFQMLSESVAMAEKYGCSLNQTATKLANAFCPGPITIIVPSTDGLTKIGFRVPEYKFIIELIKKLNSPLAATSANISGEAPALSVNEALLSLKIKPALSIDGGELPKESLSSTVVEVIDHEIRILRKGVISEKDIEIALK